MKFSTSQTRLFVLNRNQLCSMCPLGISLWFLSTHFKWELYIHFIKPMLCKENVMSSNTSIQIGYYVLYYISLWSILRMTLLLEIMFKIAWNSFWVWTKPYVNKILSHHFKINFFLLLHKILNVAYPTQPVWSH